MLDCVIRGGDVVDGTGSPRRRADVGIRDGRIVAIGDIDEAAEVTIDATGRVVAPGFVDIHTHYDAQAFWDPTLSPSSFHGVTSVAGGHCGFSIAPLTEEASDYLMRMLARVEGMPLESLREGVPWNWRSFGEYLEALDGKLAVNAGFLVGHSAIRRVVMGEAAVGEKATPEQLEQMVALLRTSLDEGGMGFSSSNAPTHNDGDGQPVPSRHAAREEFVALAAEVKNHPGTTLEFLPGVGAFDDEQYALMTEMSTAADRPLNWNVMMPARYNEEIHKRQLGASDYAKERGGRVVALTLPQPMTLRINLVSGFIFDSFPSWPEIIALPLEERKKAFGDPEVRARLDAGAHSEEAGVMRALSVWENMTIDETFAPENDGFQGRRLGDVAEELGKEPFDALCDIALADDLRTSFMPLIPGAAPEDWKYRSQFWDDPRVCLGASDAGAHLDMIDTFSLATALLQTGVRELKLLSLESAVQKLTDAPARLYGLKERGRIQEGWWADITVFDEATVGTEKVATQADLPGGSARLYADANGIEHVLVNGVEVVTKGEYTGATPGTIFRSGVDTETVLASAGV